MLLNVSDNVSRLDLLPGQITPELPLLITWLDAPKLRLVTPLEISSGFMLEYPAGIYRLTVIVRTSNTPEASVRRRFRVKFDGEPGGVLIEAVHE